MGQLFYESAWIAVVDNNNEAFEDAQDDQWQASDDESNDKSLNKYYDEMALDEIHEEDEFKQLEHPRGEDKFK
jgi:hypothetical protein